MHYIRVARLVWNHTGTGIIQTEDKTGAFILLSDKTSGITSEVRVMNPAQYSILEEIYNAFVRRYPYFHEIAYVIKTFTAPIMQDEKLENNN